MSTRNVILLFLILGSGGLRAQIGAKVQQKTNLNGVWQNNQYGYEMTLILNPDGSGEFDGEALTFSVKENILTILTNGQPVNYTYSLKDNSLLLSGGDLSEAMTFTRQAGQPGTTQTTITTNQNETPKNNAVPSPDQNSDIIGLWSASTESIEFKSNGQCTYLGQFYPYQLSPGKVTMTSPQGQVTFDYTIKEDQLSLSYNGRTVTYTKGAINSGNGQQQQSAGGGAVAQELVGKWCFINVNSYNQGASSSSECVTLNADGTYEYYNESSRSVNTADMNGGTSSQKSDRGTWYVKGDRLYVHSQTLGDASYGLEKRNHPTNVNDPMIVLDGRAFVTQYNKPPWK